METITVTYTASEADALLKLIDLAVRQGGIGVAEAALLLTGKVRNAAKDAMAMKANLPDQIKFSETEH